jgi:hypothetical protein
MKSVKAKTIRLRNKYTKEEVYTDNYNDVQLDSTKSIEFIRIYNKSNPERTYLANREAFDILSD